MIKPSAEINKNRNETIVKSELENSQKVLKHTVEFYNTPLHNNGRPNLTLNNNLITAVEGISKDYDVLISHWREDSHQEHRICYELAQSLARKSFKDLGISLGDANGNLRSTDDLLPEVLSALSSIEDPATRAATAVDILGKSAARIDWTKVSAGKDAIKDQQIKQLAEYQGAIDKLANSIETSLITAFGKLAIAIDKQGVVR